MECIYCTIFKTFDNDVDGIINKLGILGKSFGDIVDAINKRQLEINNIRNLNGGDTKAAKEQAGSIWSYLFPKKEIDESLLTQFDQFKDKFNSTTLSAEALAEEMGDVDVSIIEYAKTQKNGQLTTEGFTKSLHGMTLGAKAAKIGMQALATVGTMIAFAVISKGIELAVTAIDNYVHRVDKAKEALSNSVATFKSTTEEVTNIENSLKKVDTRIREINALGGAQFARDGELEKLQEQHDKLEENLALVKERQYYEKKDALADATASYNLTVASRYKTKEVEDNSDSLYGTVEVGENVKPVEELKLAMDEYSKLSEEYELTNNANTKNAMDAARKRAKEMAEIVNGVSDSYQIITDAGYSITDSEKAVFKEASEGMKAYTEFLNLIDLSDFNQNAGDSEGNSSIPKFDIANEDVSKEIDNYQSRLNTLGQALEKVKDSNLSGSDLLDLQQQFPQLINTTDDLGTALSKLVDDELTKVVNYLQTAGASTELINTFKQLANEVKGISFDNWESTFDVFDTAEAKLKSLAEFNKALGDSYTITADEARKYSEVFPELLALGKVTSDGLIQFNGNVVNDFVSGKQVELQSSKDAQIALLQNAKAELEAKKATAKAAIELISAKVSSEIDAENQKNSKLSEAEKNFIQYLVDLGVEETNADAIAKQVMAGNIQEYDRIVAEVSGTVYSNLTDSIDGAAGNVNSQSQTMIDSLFGVAQQAANASAVIASMGMGNPMAAIMFSAGSASQSLKDFKPSETTGEFKIQLPTEIDIEPYKEVDATVELELDISNYEKAIADIDSQIALLEASGNKSLDDYLSNDKSGGKSDSSKEPTEFDWMEQKISLIDSQVDRLRDKIDVLVGYKGKNAVADTAIDRLIEKMNTLQQMHDRYMEEAGKIGLSQNYIDKIQNGTIEIETIGDENLIKAIQEYQDLYDKAQSANDRIHDTQKSIHELNISKLDNIVNQFEKVLDIQSQIVDTEKQLLDLREKAGEEIFADDYISLAGKQLNLVRENAKSYRALSEEMAKLNLEKGSDEWKTYNDQLQDYKNNMISAASAVEDYKDAMVDLVYKGLKDFKSAMDSINGTISTMNNLIGDTNLIDESGMLTDRGLAQIALYAQQMANAKQEAAEYAEAIQSLDDALDSGLITQDEYNAMMYEYTSAQESAIQASKEAKDAILSLIKDGIQAEIDAKKKLVDETKAELEAEQELHDYQNSITEKQDNISKLERQIAALSNSTNREDIAKRLQLQSELAQAQKDLYETQYDHEIDQRKEALDKEYEDYEESKQKEMDELDSNLEAQNAAIKNYLEQVKNNYDAVYNVLKQYGGEYNLSAIDALTSPWESGTDAADLCASAIGNAISNIQYEIDSLDFSPLYKLVDLLSDLGVSHGGIGTSGSAEYDDISSQGKWQKGKDGKDWFGEDYNPNGDYYYADDGIYTINGKQYGFDDQGYMMSGWSDHFGDWRYFEPENGQMVRSSWRKDSKDQWYYLDKNGVMARDMAVKGKDSDDYYYLDEDGKYDGQPLSLEQVRKLGYTIGYKRGTRSATKGWHLMDEAGIGSEAILTDKGVLRQFNGGEIVFNPDALQNLYDIAQDPTRYIRGLSGINTNALDLSIPPMRSVSINSPLVQIDGTGLSATEVATIIKNETRDIDKRVAKSIKYELLGK